MRQLNIEERIEISRLLLKYSTREATRIFNSNNARQINQSTIARIRLKIAYEGSVHRKKRCDHNKMRKPFWLPRKIRQYFQKYPHTTLRRAVQKFNVCNKTILKILRQRKFKAYKCSINQELYDGDEAKRLDFCQKIIHRFQHDPFFKPNILWSDECLFPLNGIFNRQNHR